MNILVAGGSGFLGSHLCERLIDEGDSVYCVDNLITGRLANIELLKRHPRFRFIEADIVSELPRLPSVDRIYHLASPASPPVYCRHPIQTLRANSEGTLRLLELARADNARFLYMSSSEIYGDPLEHPQHEKYRGNVSPTGPRSMYDEAKRYGEALTCAYGDALGVDTRIIRLFNTYGPRSDPNDGRMIPNFIMQALQNEPLTIYGDGSQTRSICYVSDTIEGLVLAMEKPGTRGEVFNIGNPDEHAVLEYADLIRAAVCSKSPFSFVEQAVGDDPSRRRPDIAKARQLLGWQPTVSMEEGVDRTVSYFREVLQKCA